MRYRPAADQIDYWIRRHAEIGAAGFQQHLAALIKRLERQERRILNQS
jgi:hypothetical protein